MLNPGAQQLDILFPSTSSSTCCVFCFWPAQWFLTLKWFVVPLLPFPLPSRFSYSPVTLISMCPEQYEWVSTPPVNTTSSPAWNAFKTPPLLLPCSLTHLPPSSSHQLSHDCSACCLPTCLPESLAEHGTKKTLPLSPHPHFFLLVGAPS